MPKNYVLEAIKSRRAIRSYEDKPVPESAIETMLEAATYAPSAINIQPWKFTIITSKDGDEASLRYCKTGFTSNFA